MMKSWHLYSLNETEWHFHKHFFCSSVSVKQISNQICPGCCWHTVRCTWRRFNKLFNPARASKLESKVGHQTVAGGNVKVDFYSISRRCFLSPNRKRLVLILPVHLYVYIWYKLHIMSLSASSFCHFFSEFIQNFNIQKYVSARIHFLRHPWHKGTTP